MTIEEIDAALTQLRAARLQRLTGGVRTKIAYSGGSVEKAIGSMEELNMEIARLELERGKLTGSRSGGGPIRIGFGDRV